jgi:hypothetical protein
VQLAYLALLSNYVNSYAKLIYRIPRPADPRIVLVRPEASPSFPSGHAQNAATMGGYLAGRIHRTWVRILLIGLILLISASRLYLGVHFPQDIVGGWALAAITLLGFYWAGERLIFPWLRRQRFSAQLTLVIVTSAALLLLYPRDQQGSYPAGAAIQIAGLLMGFSIGHLLERRYVLFDSGGHWFKRALRVPIGIGLAAIGYALPGLAATVTTSPAGEIALGLIRYALAGFVVACGAPWVFVRLKLAPREP